MKPKTLKIEITEPALKALERLNATGLFGVRIEDTAQRLVFSGLQKALAPGGILAPHIHHQRRN